MPIGPLDGIIQGAVQDPSNPANVQANSSATMSNVPAATVPLVAIGGRSNQGTYDPIRIAYETRGGLHTADSITQELITQLIVINNTQLYALALIVKALAGNTLGVRQIDDLLVADLFAKAFVKTPVTPTFPNFDVLDADPNTLQ